MSSGRLLTASDIAASAPFVLMGSGRRGSGSGSGSGEVDGEGAGSGLLQEGGARGRGYMCKLMRGIPIIIVQTPDVRWQGVKNKT